MDKDAGHSLAVVNADGVAVQLKAIGDAPHQDYPPRRWGNHRGSGGGGVVNAPVVIVVGKDAVVVAAHPIF